MLKYWHISNSCNNQERIMLIIILKYLGKRDTILKE